MNFNAHNHLRTESSAKSPKEAIRKAKLLSQIELYREFMAEGFKKAEIELMLQERQI
uniref:Uncharacterized protein n=1 Tax=Shewanella putrefaciens (strain 200) TaxID=399804 RepID=E6XG65_SHEP2